MSLEPRADDGVPELTARMVRAAFPKGTLAIRIREALGPLFAEGLSDRQAAEQVRARMDWKFLLGLELDDPGFDFTVLGDFRERLIGHGMEEKVLEAVLARLSGVGLLRAGGR
jgi:transposase